MSVRFDGEVIRRNVWRPMSERIHGVTSDGKTYTCHECGHVWDAAERYVWWPVGLHFSRPKGSWITQWGAACGADRIEQRRFTRYVRIGWFVIRLGPRGER